MLSTSDSFSHTSRFISPLQLWSDIERLPPEAGFTWWFRFVFLLSSTIWNQCSWGQEDSSGSEWATTENKQRRAFPPPPPPSLSPPKDNWFLLVLRVRCSLLAPFEIGYKPVDQCISSTHAEEERISRLLVWRNRDEILWEFQGLVDVVVDTISAVHLIYILFHILLIVGALFIEQNNILKLQKVSK